MTKQLKPDGTHFFNPFLLYSQARYIKLSLNLQYSERRVLG